MAPLANACGSSTGNSRLASPFALQAISPRLVFGDRLGARIDDDGALRPVDHHRVVRPRMVEQAGDGEYRGEPQGACHDRGVAFGAPKDGGKSGDTLRVHQRSVRRGQFVGEDDGTLRHRRVGRVRLFDQIADEPGSDDPDVIDPGREIGIAHCRKSLSNLIDFELDRTLRIDARLGDAQIDAAHQTRVRQHRKVRIEKIADLLGGGFRQAGRLGLELAQLAQRNRDRLGKAAALPFDLGFREMPLADRDLPALGEMRGTDGDARRNPEAGQPPLGGYRLLHRAGDRLTPHQTCIRSAQ